MFRHAFRSPLFSPFGTRECHKIQLCIVVSLPLTEACLQFFRTSLFIQAFTQQHREKLSAPVVLIDVVPNTSERFPRLSD
jgi:hypothetical protein